MPIKYIGKATLFHGKTLWEIIGNLKNNGVGRIIIRSTFQRYPETCYYKILEVSSIEKDITDPGFYRKVNVKAEEVFRGVKLDEPVDLYGISYKTDFKLIPKNEESKYTTGLRERPIRILPATMSPPPLLKEILIRNWKNDNIQPPDNIKIPRVYKKTGKNFYRVISDDEDPSKLSEFIKPKNLKDNVLQ